MDCSPLRSSVHGIFPVRILEWVAVSFPCILLLSGRSVVSDYLQPHGWQHARLLHVYTVAYFSSFKEGNLVACYTMGSPWGHYIKWNKPNANKRQILWLCSYVISKVIRFIERQSRMVTAGSTGGQMGSCSMVREFQLYKMKSFGYLCVYMSSVMYDSLWLPGLGPTRLLCPWKSVT